MKLNLLSDEHSLFHVDCVGDVTLGEVELRHALETLLGSGCYRYKVLVKFDRVTAFDTGGVSWLLLCHQEFRKAGGLLVIHSAPPIVDQMLRLLRIHEVIHIAADEAEARTIAAGGAA